MLFTGSGRHRRQTQAEKVIAAASVAGVGLALPLIAVGGAHAAPVPTWEKVAECESGGNWSANAGDGYYGGLRFTAATWAAYGGTQYAPTADQATRSQQIAVAERVLAAEGTAGWAECAQDSGLTVGGTPGQVDSNDPASESGSLRGNKGAENVDTAPDGTRPAPHAAPTFPGVGGYDPSSGVYWYQKDGGWYWTSHQKVYEQNTAPATTPPAPPSDAPSTPAQNGQPGQNGQNGQGDQTAPTATVPPATQGPTAQSPSAPAVPPVGATPSTPDTSATPTAPGAPGTAVTPTPPVTPPVTPAAPQPYTVHTGDTLSDIAATHDVHGGWKQLYQSNEQVVGDNPDLIHPGQVLHLD